MPDHALSAQRLNSIEVPSFYCPGTELEPATHPDVQGLEQAGNKWLDASGLCNEPGVRSQVARMEVGRFVALTVPRGLTERLTDVVRLNIWFHLLDDTHGDGAPADRNGGNARIFTDLLRYMRSEAPMAPAGGAFGIVLRELCSSVDAMASDLQFSIWREAMGDYLEYEFWEADWRRRYELPQLDAYIKYCVEGRAAAASMAMLPIAAGYEIPPEDIRRAEVRALTDMACVLACFDNDIYSYAKEKRSGGFVVSLVPIISQLLGCGVVEALKESMALRDQIICRFLSLRREVSRHVDHSTRWYLRDLGSWLRGQLEWGLSSPRFADPRYAVRMPTDWATHPTTGRLDPRRLPTASWWWDVSGESL